MATSWRHLTGTDLAGARVAIQGMGNVGRRLATLLQQAGASLVLSDLDPDACAGFAGDIVDPCMIHAADVDIFAPCALGGALNAETIPAIRARLICGGANNQLAAASDIEALAARGILYCPDYLANAGGIIELHYQRSGADHAALRRHLASLADTVREVIAEAEATGATTAAVADAIALRRIRAGRS
jgi:leucine dehydrogenase